MFFRKKTYQQFTDEQLLVATAQKREGAFSVLYDRFSQGIFSYFYRMLENNKVIAEDFTQQFFMKVLEKAHLFDRNKKASTWLYAVAGNMIKNEYRRRSRQTKISSIDAAQRLVHHENHQHLYDDKIWQQHLKAALNKLHQRHRDCFVLRFQQELSIKEISEIIGCPEGTVKSRLHYATKQLSLSLKQFNPIK